MNRALRILFFSLALPMLGHAGEVPLPDAAEAQDAKRIRQLLQSQEDIDAKQVDGMTALHWAAYHDNAKLGSLLLKKGATASAENRYGITPMHLACLNGNAQFIGALIKHGTDPDSSILGGETALMTAARTGKPEAVEVLLHAGVKVDAKDRNGQTAVMWAAAEGHTSVVRALVEAGADFNLSLERSGFTAFYFAIREGHEEVVEYLLSKGADVNGAMRPGSNNQDFPRRGTGPLLLAVENGHYDLAVALLDAGANPNDTRTGFSILHALTWIRRPDIGEGAAGDPAPQGSGRRNSLQFARELINRGSSLNFQLDRGRKAGGARVSEIGATPLFMAADRADLNYMKLLVELGADPFLPNNDDTTPLMVAAGIGSQAPEEEAGNEAECLAAVKYLVSLGAEVNKVDKNGETAMHGAAYKNIPAVVQYLDSVGHDIGVWNTLNRNKRTPLLIAEGYRPGNFKPCFRTVEAITRVMLSHGIKPPPGPKPKHTRYY